MNKIKKQAIIHDVFVVIGLLITVYTLEVNAMRMSPEGLTRGQNYWRKYQDQKQENKYSFIGHIESNDHFKKFNEQLEQKNISKGWFQGPSNQWINYIVLLAFELLEPYKNRAQYASNFDELHSYVTNHICKAINDYDKQCYFHLYEPGVCNQIFTKLDNLIQYSSSGVRIEPTVANKLLRSRALESQELYDQFLKERKQREEDQKNI